ncbi:MAG: tetratricopeptide repeat protein [Armatimonadia bacterium]
MRRWPLLVVLIMLVVGPAMAQDQRRQVSDLLKSAQDLIKSGRYAEAEAKLLQAENLEPGYPGVYSNYYDLYAATGEWAKALDACGKLLMLRPDYPNARETMKLLFYEHPFPRRLRAPYLAFSSTGFANDEVRLLTPEGETARRLAYTTSMLFHEDMKRGASAVEVPIPVTASSVKCTVNRSCYGYTMPADTDIFDLDFILSYPSETLSGGRSYQGLSQKLTHLLLRFCWYSRSYLGADLPGDEPVKAFLCPRGPAGAEMYRNSLYFYDVAVERTPVEWVRQAGHELGHLVLPAIGVYERPESYASGYLGERLFAQYLALEAGLVAGDPWPSKAAQQAVAALWPGDELKLSDFIEKTCRTSLDYWHAAGPESTLLGKAGEDAMQYFVGFMMWAQAAYGPEALKAVLASDGPQAPDCVLALKTYLRRQAAKGALTVEAGSLNLAASKLAEKPLEGALGRTRVVLSPGDMAVYPMYLPAGTWTLQTAPKAEGLTVLIDGKGPLPVEAETGLALGKQDEGWHSVQLQMGEKGQPVVLERLVLRAEREM